MKVTFKNFEVKAEYTGSKKAPWSDTDKRLQKNWNHHKVTVINKETRKQASFDFWASIANPEFQTEYDVLNAFYCFVTDAISGKMDFEEFCSEFGYDTDSRTAEKTWKACKNSAKKLERIYSGDIYDLANELQEVAV